MREHQEHLEDWYEALYADKPYEDEARRLVALAEQHGNGGTRWLDAACGSGGHLAFLGDVRITGFDLSEAAVRRARMRLPSARFEVADLATFDLGEPFDVITCLFSAIGYVVTLDRLFAAARRFAAHLAPRGVLLLEPWFTPDAYRPDGRVHAKFVDRPDLKIARMNVPRVEGRVSYLDFHYLVGRPTGVTSHVESHALGLFTRDEMRGALEGAGLHVTYDAVGLTGRGLWIATRPAP